MGKKQNYVIMGLVAVFAFYYMLTVISAQTNPIVACEDVNFVANNTFYQVANRPMTDVFYVYDDSGCTNAYAAGAQYGYTLSNSSILLYTNGTAGWPNVTTGNHYVNYMYQPATTVVGINMAFLIMIAVLAAAIFAYRKLNEKNF